MFLYLSHRNNKINIWDKINFCSISYDKPYNFAVLHSQWWCLHNNHNKHIQGLSQILTILFVKVAKKYFVTWCSWVVISLGVRSIDPFSQWRILSSGESKKRLALGEDIVIRICVINRWKNSDAEAEIQTRTILV